MKAFLCALALALVPVVGSAADLHSFDYTGNGNPVPLPAPAETRSVAAPAVTPSAPSVVFLTRDSDYSAFVKADVPLATHRQAMRLLWATNPELGRPVAAEILAVGYMTDTTQSATLSDFAIASIAD